MFVERYWDLVQGVLETLPPEKNVLVLHPRCRCHTVLIDRMCRTLEADVLYIDLAEKSPSLATVWDLFSQEFEAAYGRVLPTDYDNVEDAVTMLVDALKPEAPVNIVLTLYDNVGDEVHQFVAALSEHLTGSNRILISSRHWPSALIETLPSPESAVLLPISDEDMLLNYLDDEDNRIQLEVHALGSGQVFVDGRLIEHWDGVLPRALFFYFVDRGMTTRDEVFNTFWPELSTREATNVFHVTKRKISEIIGADLTVYSSGFYRISPEIALHYDTVSFVEAVQNSAVLDDAKAYPLLARAIELHERGFLSEYKQPWVAKRREELYGIYADALTAMARLVKTDQDKALGLYGRAFGLFPYREDIARAMMLLCADLSQPQRAGAIYQRLVGELQHRLQVTPSPETEQLAAQILAVAAD